jgi:hypothetical protein
MGKRVLQILHGVMEGVARAVPPGVCCGLQNRAGRQSQGSWASEAGYQANEEQLQGDRGLVFLCV